MFDKLGLAGVLGFLIVLGGIAVLAWQNIFIAAGIALVVGGLGMVVYGLVTNLLSALGMGGI